MNGALNEPHIFAIMITDATMNYGHDTLILQSVILVM